MKYEETDMNKKEIEFSTFMDGYWKDIEENHEKNGKTFISFSGGFDSTALCILYGKKWQPIFADTGAEFPQVYEHIERVEKKLGIKVIRVKNKKYNSLLEYIRHSKYFPSWKQRYCTRMFKIDPIEKYLKQFYKFELAIGLLYEERYLRGGQWEKYAIYPLIENKITRKDTVKLCIDNDLNPNYPHYMKRGGCFNCFYKTKNEIIGLYKNEPQLFNQLIQLEKDSQPETDKIQRKKFFYMFGNIGMSLSKVKNILDNGLQLELSFYQDLTNYEQTHCGIFCRK